MKKLLLVCMLVFGAKTFAQKLLPTLNLKNLNGETKSVVTDFQEKDKIYVFSFWATWCAPCIQELDAMSEVYEDWKSKLNMEIVAVSVDDARTTKRVKPMVNGKGWPYTILLDTNQELKRGLAIANVPYIVIVKNNQIVHIQSGHNPGSEDEFFEKLKTL